MGLVIGRLLRSVPQYWAPVYLRNVHFPNQLILIKCFFSLSSCVLKWEDPHDSVVYCIDSDNKWMVISGTNRYGVVSPKIIAVTLFVKVFFSCLVLFF